MAGRWNKMLLCYTLKSNFAQEAITKLNQNPSMKDSPNTGWYISWCIMLLLEKRYTVTGICPSPTEHIGGITFFNYPALSYLPILYQVTFLIISLPCCIKWTVFVSIYSVFSYPHIHICVHFLSEICNNHPGITNFSLL